MKVKIKSIIFIFILLLVFGIGTTFALFYSNSAIPNRFKIMSYDVILNDEFDNKWGSRNVSITNNDSTSDVVIRVNYNESFSKVFDDERVYISNKINGKDVTIKEWTDDFNNDFILGEDGWFYYKKILKRKDTVNILKSINLDSNLISDSLDYDNYLKFDYELDFNYEAIKADKESISKFWNKNVEMEGENITW